MFNGIKVYLLPEGIIKARKKILENQLIKNGGSLAENLNEENLNFILIDDDLDVKKSILPKLIDKEATIGECKILRTKWLSNCIKQKSLIFDFEPFEVKIDELQTKIEENRQKNDVSEKKIDEHNKKIDEESQNLKEKMLKTDVNAVENDIYEMSTESSSSSSDDEATDARPPTKKNRFVCEKSSINVDKTQINHNKLITDKLQVLADGYKSTKDRWRALSYEKAISALKYYPIPVTTREEVKKLRGIGDRLAEKILEIIESGELRKADEFESNEKLVVMNLFNDIWGVGPTFAEQWYVQGLRTLDDVRTKVKLTHQQSIGLNYYDEFLQRIPREEAEKIVEIVTSAVKDLNPSLICVACGSYRRGRPMCGDVDLLITHPDNHSQDGVLSVLVQNLTDSGFLTDHLVECTVDGNQKKYMGVCKLPGDNQLHRRIDVIAIPYVEYPTALIYFTGSAHFVRSIYAKAKSMGMRLNAHGLRGGIMRQGGEKLNDGYLIETPTEKSVFEKVGIPYRTPEERDHP